MRKAGANEELVSPLCKGDQSGVSEPKQLGMLSYALKLTREPASVGEGDVQTLREQGWSDSAILDIAQVTAYFNFVNRMADGLGVTLIVPTLYRNTNMARDIIDKLKTYFPRQLARNILGFNVKIDEAQSHGRTIWEYAPSLKTTMTIFAP